MNRMLRRETSTLHALERQHKMVATDYFVDVMENMDKLREALEHGDVDPPAKCHHHTFDRDNRMIDFVLVFDKTARRPAKEKVNAFLKCLVREGFATEGGESDIFEHLIFIRIHCHRAKLVKSGIVLDWNLAFASEYVDRTDHNVFFNFDFLFNDLTRPTPLSDISQRAGDTVHHRKPKDITNAERIMVTYELLKNSPYGDNEDEFGITSLLHKHYLHAAFPLHDGTAEWSDDGPLNDRQILMKYWASTANWYKLQPIDLVKNYFGAEVAFYFAFLGYFNKMLIIPACAGIVTIIFGILTYDDHRNYKSYAICSSNITICPPCHDIDICHFESLSNECHTSCIAYILDNFATTMYTIFWCFWSTIVYAKWKRREAVLIFKWNLTDLENEVNVHPGYVGRSTHAHAHRHSKRQSKRRDSTVAPHETREGTIWRVMRYCASGFMIFLLIFVILLVLYIAVIVRWWTGMLIGRFDGQFSFQWRILLVTTVGNLFVIGFVCIAEDLFEAWAHWVTSFENPRTVEEYNQSYVYKYAVLCFITSYSFICYTAYLKGRFSTHPGHELPFRILGILNYDLEKIHTSMMSVSYQWTMMTIGKELWKMMVPPIRPWRNRSSKIKNFKAKSPRIWEAEYQLQSHDHPFLLEENMRIILQYGYLVLFPGANPLGPLAYFWYNVWALRRDATRALAHSRRMVPLRTPGIGPWLKLIKMLTILGMGTNVFFIAFTSNFVPQMCKWFNPFYTNYSDYTFSKFAVDDYPDEFGRELKEGRSGTFCFYKSKRFPPESAQKYTNTVKHWNFVSAQFLAVLIIQGFVIIFCGLILFAMSDTPHFIKESIRHRTILKQERREERFRRDKNRRSTGMGELRNKFTVIGY